MTDRYVRNTLYVLMVILFANCEQTSIDMPDEETVITVSAGRMEYYGGTTRSGYTMWPEEENCIKTLAFFQFDPEGMHNRKELYNFRAYASVDNPHGVLKASISDVKFKSYNNNNTTICVVANITKKQVDEFYDDLTTSTSTQVRLDDFKKWTHKFQYKENADSLGHLKQMCMFGLYYGTMEGDEVKRLILGRLCSRIEVTLKAENETDFTDGVELSFDNVPTEAYYFSTGVGVTESRKNGLFITSVYPSAEEKIFYFYMPGNSAQTLEEALKLKITFGNQVRSVALCMSPPGQNEDFSDYAINRNSIYRFNINLKKKVSTRNGIADEYFIPEPTVSYCGQETDVWF